MFVDVLVMEVLVDLQLESGQLWQHDRRDSGVDQQLKARPRIGRPQQLAELVAHPLDRDHRYAIREFVQRECGRGCHGEPELGGETRGPHHPQRIVAEGVLRCARRGESFRDEVFEAPGRIDEHALGKSKRHSVDREVAPHQVLLEGVAELDDRLAGLAVIGIGPVGGDLHRVPVDARPDGAEGAADVPVGIRDRFHQGEDVVRSRVGGEVEVGELTIQERVSHGSPDESEFESGHGECRRQSRDVGGGREVRQSLNCRSDALHAPQTTGARRAAPRSHLRRGPCARP